MAAADLLVLLGHVQYEKGGYQSRFNCGGRWRSMAVERHGGRLIADKRYQDPARDWGRIKRALPHHADKLARWDIHVCPSLLRTNARILMNIAAELGIGTPVVLDGPTALTGTARLVEICQVHGATRYLSGPSGRHYLDLSLFERAGIGVDFFEAAKGDRVPVLDAL
jgi:hypothetical protein